MANWVPDGFVGEVQRLSARYVPPRGDVKPPALWGTEARLRELLGSDIASLRVARRSANMRYRSEQDWLEFTRSYLGPVRQIFHSLWMPRNKARWRRTHWKCCDASTARGMKRS